MQQTKSYWYLLAALGVAGSFVGAACTVTSSNDVGFGDAGAGDVAGSANAGSANAGASGTAGSGGAAAGTGGVGGTTDPTTVPACDTGDTPAGTPATTCDPGVVDDCSTCIHTHCCTEYSNCFSTSPGDVCGYGGPDNNGEFACYQGCLQDLFKKNGSLDSEDAKTCGNQCVTSTDAKGALDCGALGVSTNALIGCVMDNACNGACYGS